MESVQAEAREGTAPAGEALLRIHLPSGAVDRHRLEARKTVTIGRSSDNSLRLDDTMASRHHARLEWGEAEGWVVHDLGAKNGTLVNGEPVERWVLKDGDQILIGDTVVTFHLHREETTSNLKPALAEVLRASKGADETGSTSRLVAATAPLPDLPVEAVDALASFGELLSRSPDQLEVLDEAAGRLVELFDADRATILLVEEGGRTPVIQFSRASESASESEELEASVLQAALTADKPICLRFSRANNVLGTPLGVKRHLLLLPLMSRDSKLGLMVLERTPARPAFDEEELARARLLGAPLSLFVRRML